MIKTVTAMLAGMACLASGPGQAAEPAFFTGSDGIAWSLERSSILPMQLGTRVYQYWLTGTSAPGAPARRHKVRVYMDCKSQWSVASAIVSSDASGTIISSSYKGWAPQNWTKPNPAGVIAQSAKLVCPAA